MEKIGFISAICFFAICIFSNIFASKQRDEIQNQSDEKNERYLYLLELQEQIENQ